MTSNRVKKETLFKDWVCDAICPYTLSLMEEREINKLITVAMYQSLVLFKNKSKADATGIIVRQTNIPDRSVRQYIRRYIDEQERENLKLLFRENACSLMCTNVLDNMSTAEMRRLVIISMFEKARTKTIQTTKEIKRSIVNQLQVSRIHVHKILDKYQQTITH